MASKLILIYKQLLPFSNVEFEDTLSVIDSFKFEAISNII